MKVKLEGQEYWIEFDYGMVYMECLDDSLLGEREKTACFLRDALAPKDNLNHNMAPIVARGEVVRYYKDAPNREVARKVALGKALADLDRVLPCEAETAREGYLLDKTRRKLFWAAYLNRKAAAVGKAGA